MDDRTYKIATSYPPFSREITVKTLGVGMDYVRGAEYRNAKSEREWGFPIEITEADIYFPSIIGPTDASLEKAAYDANVKFNREMQARLNIAKHRCS